MKFDIPINFTVEADSEEEALENLKSLLKHMMFTDGHDIGILDWELFEFIPMDNTND